MYLCEFVSLLCCADAAGRRRKVVVVFFIGGVTYLELAALRFMTDKCTCSAVPHTHTPSTHTPSLHPHSVENCRHLDANRR